MIDIRKLKELVRLMVANDLTELDLRDPEEQVLLRRGGSQPQMVTHVAPPPAAAVAMPAAAPGASAPAAAEPAPPDDSITKIESPMVGTFYDKPNPDSPPFVTVGARVTPDTVVCLVEAMKIFNEIKAECSGTVHRVLPDNGAPIEFGEALFEIKKD